MSEYRTTSEQEVSEQMLRREKLAHLEKIKREQEGGLAKRQEALASALDRLGSQLERLEERLQPVLRDPEPQPALHATPDGRLGSPLAMFMTGAAGHADGLGRRVAELAKRVDL